MTTEELARALTRAATDSVLEVMPWMRGWEWKLEQAIEYGLRRQLLILQEEKRRQMAAARPMRRKKAKGGVA